LLIGEYVTKILKNQEEEEIILRNATEVVNSQSESLQSLDFHKSQIRGYNDTPIIYFDEAFESLEEDPFSSFSTITTRSRKVLRSQLRMIVEEDIHDDEKQCLNLDSIPREM
ncbi:hypothetical protein HAX54_008781, partial [Datura stramonium]|nr:hypothetical protein [Datura stramonium]